MNVDADGAALMFWIGCLFAVWLCIAAVVEQVVERRARRKQITHIDFNRCERAGSQREFERRLRARGTR